MASSARSPGLQRSRRIPLHTQVAQHLRDEIAGRRLPPGTVLPSEAALCQRFGVARSVVRQALAALVAEGLIQRDPGRAPVVAAPREHRRLVQRSMGLFEQFAQMGVTLGTEVLSFQPAEAPAEVAEFLQTRNIIFLERLRRLEGRLLAYVRTWLPAEMIPGLKAEDMRDASLHRILASRYGVHPKRGRNRIRAVGADTDMAARLEVPVGSPLLMLEGQSLDQQERPMEWFTTWHRPENMVFDVDVGPAGEHVQAALQEPAAAYAPTDPSKLAREASLDEVERTLIDALSKVRALRA